MRRLALIAVALFSVRAAAYFQMDLMNGKRAANLDNVQWTLGDWLAQKSRMSLADTWLALHRQVSWVEFDPMASARRYSVTTKSGGTQTSVSQDAQVYGANLYIGLFSLSGEYEKTSTQVETYGGAAGLRLMGLSEQSTSLVGRYGWQHRQDLRTHEIWDNPYAEAALQLYLVKHFGLSGTYRYYFADLSNLGTRRQGTSLQGGLFFDIGAARLFANALQEPIETDANGTVTRTVREGYEGGIKLFF